MEGIWKTEVNFLYPKKGSSRLPITKYLVLALEKRDFRVPDVEVEFRGTGRGTDYYKYVRNIKWISKGWSFFYCYRQGYIPGYDYQLYDIAAISEICIDSKKMKFFDDYSGPLYTEEEKEDFTKKIQEFIDYIGTFPIREHKPFKNFPFVETIEDFEILKQNKPYLSTYPTLFVEKTEIFGKPDPNIIINFNQGFDELKKRDRIFAKGDKRLVHYMACKNRDIKIHPRSNDGFIWCKTHEDIKKEVDKCIYNQMPAFLVEVRPHHTDDIYVADMEPYHTYRKECFKTTSCLSDDQYNRSIALKGSKMCTFDEYITGKVTVVDPQILIRKNIGYDEIVKIHEIRRKCEDNKNKTYEYIVHSKNHSRRSEGFKKYNGVEINKYSVRNLDDCTVGNYSSIITKRNLRSYTPKKYEFYTPLYKQPHYKPYISKTVCSMTVNDNEDSTKFVDMCLNQTLKNRIKN